MAISEIAAALSSLNFRRPFCLVIRLPHKIECEWSSGAQNPRSMHFVYIGYKSNESGHWRARLRRTPIFCSLLFLKMMLPHLSLVSVLNESAKSGYIDLQTKNHLQFCALMLVIPMLLSLVLKSSRNFWVIWGLSFDLISGHITYPFRLGCNSVHFFTTYRNLNVTK
jgi:hypothetical protein